MAKVSIIIPTHNRPDILMERAVPSVLNQETKHEIELIVIGDGTDSLSVERMGDLVSRDSRVTFENLPKNPNLPESKTMAWNVLGGYARNRGHDLATGEYVGGLDDDDEFTANHIEVLVGALEWYSVDFAYGKSLAFKSDGRKQLYGRWPPGYTALCDGAAIWRRSLQYRYDPKCIDRGLPEDGDLWERMKAGGVKFTFVDKIIHHYYPNPEGGSA